MGMPRELRLYDLGLTAVSSLVALGALLSHKPFPPGFVFGGFLAAYALMELFQVMSPVGASPSLGSAVALAAVVWTGCAPALLLQATGTAVIGLVRRMRPNRIRMNVSRFVVSIAAADFVFRLAGGVVGQPFGAMGVPLLAAVIALVLADAALMALVLSQSEGRLLAACLGDLWGLPLALSALAVALSVPLLAAMTLFGLFWALGGAALLAAGVFLGLKTVAGRAREPHTPRWAAVFHDTGLADAALEAAASAEPLPLPEPLPVAGLDLWSRNGGNRRRSFWRLFSRGPLRLFQPADDPAADWYRGLLDLSRAFSSSLNTQVIARQLADAVHSLTTLPCIVHLVAEDGLTLAPAAVNGLPAQAVETLHQTIHEGLLGQALTDRRPVTSPSALAVPMWVGGTPLGAIGVNSPTARRFSPSEVRALTALADLAALALYNAFLYRKAGSRLERLIETQMHLEAVVDAVPAGILIFAPDGHLVSANSRATAHLADLDLVLPGTPPEEGAGEVAANVIEALSGRLGATAPSWALAHRAPYGPEAVSAEIEEGERHFEVWASPLHDSKGTLTGLLVILDDVTEARRLAAEVHRTEKLAAVGEVAARAAHEIKNPLAAIHGFTQLMGLYCPVRDGWQECPKYVERISGEISRLSEIAHSMLTLARPARPKFVTGNLAAVVEETIEFLAGKAAERGTTLERAGGPPTVMADFDPRQLKQVLLNLVQNALDAVSGPGGPPPGWRKVAVAVGYTHRARQRHIFIQVRDNGPGLRGPDRAKVFTPFFTTKDTGTGLGLPIAKSIIEAHDGVVDLRPAHGRGCVFEILLPVSSATSRSGSVIPIAAFGGPADEPVDPGAPTPNSGPEREGG